MYDPETQNVANCYRVKQAKLIRLPGMPSASADGWTGAFMHSWRPDMIQAAYEKQRAKDLLFDANGKVTRIAFDPAFELGLGFFSLLAVELGDLETADALFTYADRNYSPIREKGALHYPTRMNAPKDKVSNTSDKVIAMARSNRPNGLLNIHDRPWGDDEFKYPLLVGVDFPRVVVSEARWNKDGKTLVIEMLPGYDAPAETSFRIQGVKSGEAWSLSRDGKQIGSISPDGGHSGAIANSDSPGEIAITIPLQSRCRLELKRLP
jgi:hypothetical protein